LVHRNAHSTLLLVFLALPLLFLIAATPSLSAQAADTGKKADAQEKPSESSINLLPSALDETVPINTEKLDEAGQMLGKKIDEVGRGASKKFGKWIDAKAFLGITWLKLLACFILLIIVMAVDRASHYLLAKKVNQERTDGKTSTWWKLFLEALHRPLSLFIKIYGIYWALTPILSHLDASGGQGLIHRFAGKAADLGGTTAIFWFAYRFIHVVDTQLKRWASLTHSTIDDMLVPLVGKTLRIFVLAIGSIMVLQNITGIDIGPLIASLGIGGLAFALAGKDSIANFFGSLTILLDKPFQVGERIIIDQHDGFVENVGFRSTRLRTLTGNLVSIPNEKIINSTLENIGRRTHIRWRATLTLTYDTPPEKVERAVEILREILHNHERMRENYPPQAHFAGFGDWSLNITVYAWYHSSNNWEYQSWLERTCLEIMRRFRAEGIEFAFPTQTVYQINSDAQLESQPFHSAARL
jgi:MscS family membrane protein